MNAFDLVESKFVESAGNGTVRGVTLRTTTENRATICM